MDSKACTVDDVVMQTMVRLVRKVRWGLNRIELEAKAGEFDAEATQRRGWDDFYTAAGLNWSGRLHRLAAEVRFPREGDREIAAMRAQVVRGIAAHLQDAVINEDVGELERHERGQIASALEPSLDESTLDALRAEMAQTEFQTAVETFGA